jgi:hypothetical protein
MSMSLSVTPTAIAGVSARRVFLAPALRRQPELKARGVGATQLRISPMRIPDSNSRGPELLCKPERRRRYCMLRSVMRRALAIMVKVGEVAGAVGKMLESQRKTPGEIEPSIAIGPFPRGKDAA